MERQERIVYEGKKLMGPIFQNQMPELMNEYRLHQKEILDSLYEKTLELFQQAADMQRNGNRGSINCMGICYLLSSTLTQNYELRLDLYDQEFYLDDQECCVYWMPKFIISYLEKDIQYFKKAIKTIIPRVRTYEMQVFIDGYRGNYMYLLIQFFRQMLPELIKRIEQTTDCLIAEEFRVIFGEYMGNFTVVAERTQKE